MDRSSFPKGHMIDRSNVKQYQYTPDEELFRPKRITDSFEIERISLDKRCEEKLKTGDTFIISEPAINTKRERSMGGIYSPRFGADMFNPDIKEYSCDCGFSVGAIKEGKICSKCGTVVTFVATDLSREAYINIYPYHILSYHGWNAMSRVIKKFDEVIKSKNKHSIDRSGGLIVHGGINLLDLYDMYDEKYYPLTGIPKDVAFISKIPVLNAGLRPLILHGSKMTVFPINKVYQTLQMLAGNLEISMLMNVDNKLEILRTITEIQEQFNEVVAIFETRVKGKGSLFKEHVNRSRLDYTCRAVIASEPKLKINEIMVPYQTMLELYEEELVCFIMKVKRIDIMAATDFFIKCRNVLNKEMLAIINLYLKGNECWMLIDRNPTIKYGGILYMRVVACHKNLKNKTMLLPHNILPLQNADFDGDQETLTAMKVIIDSPYSYHNLFKAVFSPTYMIIDKATGKFNTCMGPKRDKLAILYELFDISKMMTHINSMDSDILESSDDPYMKKFNALLENRSRTLSPADDDANADWMYAFGDEGGFNGRISLGSAISDILYSGDTDATDLDEDLEG